jgi:hypothetical protein
MNFYVVTYSAGAAGCPHYLTGDYSPEEWEFDTEEADPVSLKIDKQYPLKITDSETSALLFDFYEPSPTIVSQEFLHLCEKYKAKYRAIPLNITRPKKRPVQKQYSIFLPGDHIALLDVNSSIAEAEINTDTGGPLINKTFPTTPVYAKIERFVPKNTSTPSLFWCVEIGKLMCTEEFQKGASSAGLYGLVFVHTDDFRHDPWG